MRTCTALDVSRASFFELTKRLDVQILFNANCVGFGHHQFVQCSFLRPCGLSSSIGLVREVDFDEAMAEALL